MTRARCGLRVARTLARVLYGSAMLNRLRARAILYAFALVTGYLGVVVWLTWPLAASVRSSMPSEGFAPSANQFDLYYSVWVLAHESHALVSAATSFAQANIYHPAPDALFYGPVALGALPLFAPVFLSTGNPVLAINVTFLLGIALTGVAMHVVVRRWTGSDLAGAVGAVTVIFNQWLIRGFVPTAPHWSALCYLPLIAFLAATRLDSMRWVLLLAPLVALQSLTEIVYVTPAVVGPLGVLAALRIVRRSTRAAGLRLIVALALAMLPLVPVCRGYLTVRAANPDLAMQTKWPYTEADHPAVLPDQVLRGGVPFLLTPAMMGLVALGVAALLWRHRSRAPSPRVPGGWAHGALWTVVGGCLALPPVVLLGGMEIRTPIGYLSAWFPSLQAIRMPSRIGIAGLVGLGILSGVAFGEISALIRTYVRRGRWAPCLSGALAVMVVYLAHQAYGDNYWHSSYGGNGPMPAEYQLQAAPSIPASFLPILRSGRTALIELPLVSPVNPSGHALAMFHSISHWRPILNGYSSYWPAGFPERITEAGRLPARDALDHLVESTGLSLIWVHTQSLPSRKHSAWTAPPRPGGGRRGLTLVAQEGPELLFAVEQPAG